MFKAIKLFAFFAALANGNFRARNKKYAQAK